MKFEIASLPTYCTALGIHPLQTTRETVGHLFFGIIHLCQSCDPFLLRMMLLLFSSSPSHETHLPVSLPSISISLSWSRARQVDARGHMFAKKNFKKKKNGSTQQMWLTGAKYVLERQLMVLILRMFRKETVRLRAKGGRRHAWQKCQQKKTRKSGDGCGFTNRNTMVCPC